MEGSTTPNASRRCFTVGGSFGCPPWYPHEYLSSPTPKEIGSPAKIGVAHPIDAAPSFSPPSPSSSYPYLAL
eukprot:CAMPEP_0172757778 /NCGR_PEP_ID=MMETSP1074-20121228/164453_1 /TAXON_ID=2916 /ORGANISM="Ceratium fusus, Strain PA161109" /LENGTH=71 /DNA_ID=CAMNT_0013591247 /DNA_START=160 /DNA_END=375 /DNA_ORIENTATION=+